MDTTSKIICKMREMQKVSEVFKSNFNYYQREKDSQPRGILFSSNKNVLLKLE
jgi:hypothetical protein